MTFTLLEVIAGIAAAGLDVLRRVRGNGSQTVDGESDVLADR